MPDDARELRKLIAELTERVYRLEQRAGVEQAKPAPPPPPLVARNESAFVPPPVTATHEPASVQIPSPLPEQVKERESLESRIGAQWLNRVGVIAVLVGVSYFLKYAFENNWIGAAGRIVIGLLAGIAIVVWSERFRANGHLRFSWSLKAVGIGTMYLSLWAAFQMYHLVSSATAFAAMVVVTASTAALALRQNAQILAAFALIGGFITPLLLSTGENHELALFSYVAVLDIATLALLACRPWMRLLIGAFAGTLVLYIGWYAEYYTRAQLGSTFLFATLFFALFALAPVLSLQGPSQPARQVAIALILVPLLNALTYFLQAYAMLEGVSRMVLAWIAVALAAVYLVLSREGMKRARDENAARLLKLLYTALAVGFLTTAVPLKLETHWITIAWFIEAAALMWISYRAPSPFLRVLASVALVLGIGRLLVFDNFNPATLIANARFATYLIAIAALAWSAALTRQLPPDDVDGQVHRRAAGVVVILSNILALVALSFEVRDYFARDLQALQQANQGRTLPWVDLRQLWVVRDFTYSAVLMFYGAALMWVGFWRRTAFLRWQALALIAVTAGKVFVYDVSELERGYRILSFIGLGVLLLAVSFIYQRDWLRLSSRKRAQESAEGNSTPA